MQIVRSGTPQAPFCEVRRCALPDDSHFEFTGLHTLGRARRIGSLLDDELSKLRQPRAKILG